MFARTCIAALFTFGIAVPSAQAIPTPESLVGPTTLTETELLTQKAIPQNILLAGDAGKIIGGAILGGLVVNAMSRESRAAPPPERSYYYDRGPRRGGGYHAAKERCAARYNSYDWDTDTFMTYEGEERLCPYVRPYY